MGGSGHGLRERSPRPRVDVPRPSDGTGVDHGGGRIRCPQCRWQPGRGDRWSCDCSHTWNTFDTRGVCPACGRVWTETQCPRCLEWSRHDDWYEHGGPGGDL
jgi:hypothetical protein